jgi:hypothetical protein
MPITPRAKCQDGVCYAASPNLECETFSEGQCQTIVMGYGGDGQLQGEPLFRATPGIRVSAVTERLEALGIGQGDVITHIDGKSLHSLDRAAVMSRFVNKGTKLTVIKADGGRLLVEVD